MMSNQAPEQPATPHPIDPATLSAYMVDTIRADDPNHLVFAGAQYIAEMVDWEYRPNGRLALDRVPTYQHLARQMLDDCGRSCWNVWSLTAYDFNPYPIDDAMTFSKGGAAVVATEYGFTLGSPKEMAARFGGDRAAAVRNGWDHPWQDLQGNWHRREWGVGELFSRGLVTGVAPWGSPAPGPWSGFDQDGARGITGVPDQTALWTAWGDVAATLASADRVTGPAPRCTGVTASQRQRPLTSCCGSCSTVLT